MSSLPISTNSTETLQHVHLTKLNQLTNNNGTNKKCCIWAYVVIFPLLFSYISCLTHEMVNEHITHSVTSSYNPVYLTISQLEELHEYSIKIRPFHS